MDVPDDKVNNNCKKQQLFSIDGEKALVDLELDPCLDKITNDPSTKTDYGRQMDNANDEEKLNSALEIPISLDDIILPFEEETQDTRNRDENKKKKRARQSREFRALDSNNILPDFDNLERATEFLGVRRSNRIRRKSIVLFRAEERRKTLEKSEKEEISTVIDLVNPVEETSSNTFVSELTMAEKNTEEVPVCENPDTKSTDTKNDVATMSDLYSPELTRIKDHCSNISEQSELKPDTTNSPMETESVDAALNECNEKPRRVPKKKSPVTTISEGVSPEVPNTDNSTISRRSGRARKKVISLVYEVEEPVKKKKQKKDSENLCDKIVKKKSKNTSTKAVVIEDQPSPSPVKRKGKNSPNISLEDVYRNKNYEKPVDRVWETIYEESDASEKPDEKNIFSRKRLKRFIEFDNQQSLVSKYKRRMQKAKKRGFKRLTGKKEAMLKKLHDERWKELTMLNDSVSESEESSSKCSDDTDKEISAKNQELSIEFEKLEPIKSIDKMEVDSDSNVKTIRESAITKETYDDALVSGSDIDCANRLNVKNENFNHNADLVNDKIMSSESCVKDSEIVQCQNAVCLDVNNPVDEAVDNKENHENNSRSVVDNNTISSGVRGESDNDDSGCVWAHRFDDSACSEIDNQTNNDTVTSCGNSEYCVSVSESAPEEMIVTKDVPVVDTSFEPVDSSSSSDILNTGMTEIPSDCEIS